LHAWGTSRTCTSRWAGGGVADAREARALPGCTRVVPIARHQSGQVCGLQSALPAVPTPQGTPPPPRSPPPCRSSPLAGTLSSATLRRRSSHGSCTPLTRCGQELSRPAGLLRRCTGTGAWCARGERSRRAVKR
jgi:hypothetical protein